MRRLPHEAMTMLTGPDFREEHVLDDGMHVTLRHIQPEDADELRRGFQRLSRASRYRRFQSVVNELSPRAVHYLTHVDGADHVAIVATRRESSGGEVGLGVARFVRSRKDSTLAEVALTVVDEAQGKGLGRILSVAIARAAIERGVHRLQGPILGDNFPIRGLLDEVGAKVHTGVDGTSFEVDLEPPSEPHHHGRLELGARRLVRAVADAFSPSATKRLETPT